MTDMDAETTTHTEPTVVEEEPLFSNLDLFLFSLIIGLVIYWFMSRKKPEPLPEFKKLDTPWVPVMVYLGFNAFLKIKVEKNKIAFGIVKILWIFILIPVLFIDYNFLIKPRFQLFEYYLNKIC